MKIDGKEYKLKYTLRMFYLFEQVQTGSYAGGIYGNCLLFYCCLKANNQGFEMDFEKFTDCLDDDPDLLEDFMKFLQTNQPKDKKKVKADEP